MRVKLLFISICCALCLSGFSQEEKTPVFEVSIIENINSKRSDFCPTVVGNKLVFVSERESDLLNYGEINFSWAPHTTLLYSNIKKSDSVITYSTPRMYKPAYFANSSYVGPITFMNQNMIYSKVDMSIQDSLGISRPGIYMEGHVFEYNSPNFSCSQPTIDRKNMVLYFTSDMPGGFGGTDLYKCEFEKGQWQKPENLGSTINSTANESFPFIHEDGILWFSSDRSDSYGELDLYYCNIEKEGLVNHVKDESINSAQDDFGIYIYPKGESGFCSSNRGDSLQKDKIYAMKIKWIAPEKEVVKEEGITMAGYFSYKLISSEQPKGIRVYLVDDDGKVIYQTLTNEQGFFSFQNLDPQQNYFIKIDATNQDFELSILADNSDEVTAVLSNDKTGMFLYRELSFEQIGSMGLLYTTDDAKMEGGQLTKTFNGQFRFKYLDSDSLGGLIVQLLDDKGNVVYTTSTDEQGIFSFRNLPLDQNYIVKLSENNPDIELLAINDQGVIAELNQNRKGEFVFVKMAQSAANSLFKIKEEDVSLFADTNTVMAQFLFHTLKETYVVRKTVIITNKIGDLVTSAVTDNEGKIYIDKTVSGDSLSFTLKETDSLETVRMFLYNHNNQEFAVLSPKNGVFKYRFLEGESSQDPTLMNEEDMKLALEGKETIDEGEVMVNKVSDDILVIYFGINSSDYDFSDSEELKDLLSKLTNNTQLQIDITAFSDKTGTNEYNKDLSFRRAKSVVNYLTTNGIARNRITSRGLGATNFAVACEACTEQQNQLNRRSVLRIK
ncbi:MAG: OmpA family protein [Flavobacteriales bacterium]|nr:OmpA family protein [Flavobacteriales bacterium]